jgi:ketosteroid isomerase-like protein
MPRLQVTLFVLLLAFATACQTQTQSQTPAPPDTRAADEATLRNLDAEWSKAAGAKDVDKTVSYYSADAMVLPPNSPVLADKEMISAMWKAMLTAPGFAGGWKTTKVDVAHSGDLAYVIGNYEMTENDADKKPRTDKGKYLEVWKKQADGNWKCVADMFSTDLPAATRISTTFADKTKSTD